MPEGFAVLLTAIRDSTEMQYETMDGEDVQLVTTEGSAKLPWEILEGSDSEISHHGRHW